MKQKLERGRPLLKARVCRAKPNGDAPICVTAVRSASTAEPRSATEREDYESLFPEEVIIYDGSPSSAVS